MALVLARYNQESILIGDDIKITIFLDGSHQAKVAIEAPTEIPIWREELLERADSD